jgi:3-hydroxyisobutyrate dehydrogenase-like beta-hydroxyacid dehydrogenase
VRIGILHPGEMGSAVAATVRNTGHEVWWVSEGRSHRSRARAESAGLTDAGTLAQLCETCPVILSVCPPEFAADLADQVLAHGFRGTYLDANAISPAHKQAIATWLYLSGEHAESVACLFQAGPLEAEVIGTEVGKASALKMCYAAQNKGSIALLTAVMGAADRLGVLDELRREWARPGRAIAQTEAHVLRAAPKAWRWSAEMHEIASTLEAAGMPPEFHQAAAEIFDKLREFKDANPSIEEVLQKLRVP